MGRIQKNAFNIMFYIILKRSIKIKPKKDIELICNSVKNIHSNYNNVKVTSI